MHIGPLDQKTSANTGWLQTHWDLDYKLLGGTSFKKWQVFLKRNEPKTDIVDTFVTPFARLDITHVRVGNSLYTGVGGVQDKKRQSIRCYGLLLDCPVWGAYVLCIGL